MQNKYPPYIQRLSFEYTVTEQGEHTSCGLVHAPGVVGSWPVPVSTEHGPRYATTHFNAVQLLVHRDLNLAQILSAIDELRALVTRRLGDFTQAPQLDSVLHDPSWQENLAAREHFAQTGEVPAPRRHNFEENQ